MSNTFVETKVFELQVNFSESHFGHFGRATHPPCLAGLERMNISRGSDGNSASGRAQSATLARANRHLVQPRVGAYVQRTTSKGPGDAWTPRGSAPRREILMQDHGTDVGALLTGARSLLSSAKVMRDDDAAAIALDEVAAMLDKAEVLLDSANV